MAGTSAAAADADYLKQVLDRFAKRQNSFVTQFTILIIFTLSFIAFILAPMIALKLDANRLTKELREKETLVADLQAQADDLKANRDELTSKQNDVNGELTSLFKIQDDARVEAEETQRQIDAKRDEIDAITAENARLERSQAGLKDAASQMTAALGSFDPAMRTSDLRNWFREIVNSGSRDPECAGDVQYGDLGCMVRNKLHRDWEADFARIDAEAIAPLRAIEPDAADEIESRIQKARDTFEATLEENPDFWRTVNEKEEFMELLGRQFDVAFSDIAQVIQGRSKDLAETAKVHQETIASNTSEADRLIEALAAIKARQADIAADQERALAKQAEFEAQYTELEAQIEPLEIELNEVSERVAKDSQALDEAQKRIEDEQNRIAERLTKFQSPFGSLPIGLNEATLAFPFILAVGFLICALLQADLLNLRGEYHALMWPGGDTEGGSAEARARAAHRVTLVAPLWLDPERPAWLSLAGAVLLLLPALAFAATVCLILLGFLQLADSGSSERYLRGFYFGLYAIGVFLVIVGIGRVTGKWIGYHKRVRS